MPPCSNGARSRHGSACYRATGRARQSLLQLFNNSKTLRLPQDGAPDAPPYRCTDLPHSVIMTAATRSPVVCRMVRLLHHPIAAVFSRCLTDFYSPAHGTIDRIPEVGGRCIADACLDGSLPRAVVVPNSMWPLHCTLVPDWGRPCPHDHLLCRWRGCASQRCTAASQVRLLACNQCTERLGWRAACAWQPKLCGSHVALSLHRLLWDTKVRHCSPPHRHCRTVLTCCFQPPSPPHRCHHRGPDQPLYKPVLAEPTS